MAAHQEGSTECGYCLVKDDQLVDPRIFPCNHVSCYPCLEGAFENNKIVRCGKCREVFDVTLAKLPCLNIRGNDFQFCDVCTEKKDQRQPAVSYCTTCDQKMCTVHDKSHTSLEHSDVVTIEEYKTSVIKSAIRTCSRHAEKAVVKGCMDCCNAVCAACIEDTKACKGGSPHSLITLEALVSILKRKNYELKLETYPREEEFSRLVKYSTKVLSEFEGKTEDMMQLLHTTRDEQVSDDVSPTDGGSSAKKAKICNEKYEELERDLVEKRKKSTDQMLQFMEQVGAKLTELNTVLVLQDAKFRDAQPVDIIFAFRETVKEVRRLIDEELPVLSLKDVVKLSTATDKDTGLAMVEDDAVIISKERSMGQVAPQNYLKLKAQIEIKDGCYAACSHEGFTYIAGSSFVYKINESDWTVKYFIAESEIRNMACCNGNMYIFTGEYYFYVYVYSLKNGKLVKSFPHRPEDSAEIGSSTLTVVPGKVVVPDNIAGRMSVYSPKGRLSKHIPCLQLDPGGYAEKLSICAADKNSVVASCADSSTVMRIDLRDGKVMWSCKEVKEPAHVACYGDKYVLVAAREPTQTEMFILDIATGKCLGRVSDPEEKVRNEIRDIHVSGSTVVVARGAEGFVSFYELMGDLPDGDPAAVKAKKKSAKKK